MSFPFNLSFNHEFQFHEVPPHTGLHPAVLVGLIGPNGADDLLAIIDTGAAYSIFDGKRASPIGLDLMSGKRVMLGGLAGSLPARLHSVIVELFGTRFRCDVAFSEGKIHRELLGRHSLFPFTRFGFREGMSVGYFHPEP